MSVRNKFARFYSTNVRRVFILVHLKFRKTYKTGHRRPYIVTYKCYKVAISLLHFIIIVFFFFLLLLNIFYYIIYDRYCFYYRLQCYTQRRYILPTVFFPFINLSNFFCFYFMLECSYCTFFLLNYLSIMIFFLLLFFLLRRRFINYTTRILLYSDVLLFADK